jgi:hypothetical protein
MDFCFVFILDGIVFLSIEDGIISLDCGRKYFLIVDEIVFFDVGGIIRHSSFLLSKNIFFHCQKQFPIRVVVPPISPTRVRPPISLTHMCSGLGFRV